MSEKPEYENQTSIGGDWDGLARFAVFVIGCSMAINALSNGDGLRLAVGVLIIDRAYMLFRWRLM